MNDGHVDRYCSFYENLSPERLGQVSALFHTDAVFRDPFNHVRGHAAIKRIFGHLLRQYPHTRFLVTETCVNGHCAYLRWTFEPGRDERLCIEGVSRVRFDRGGLVLEHRDYWDSAGELFVRLPLIGAPMRWLLRRFTASRTDQLD